MDFLHSTMFPSEHALFRHNKVVENTRSDAELVKTAAEAYWGLIITVMTANTCGTRPVPGKVATTLGRPFDNLCALLKAIPTTGRSRAAEMWTCSLRLQSQHSSPPRLSLCRLPPLQSPPPAPLPQVSATHNHHALIWPLLLSCKTAFSRIYIPIFIIRLSLCWDMDFFYFSWHSPRRPFP